MEKKLIARSEKIDGSMASQRSAVTTLLQTLDGSLVRTERTASRMAMESSVKWRSAAAAAISRKELSCPICMGDLSELLLQTASGLNTPTCGAAGVSLRCAVRHHRAVQQKLKYASTTPRPCALLSCSHVFHENCIDAFETFALGRTSKENGCLCPICRQEYIRKPFAQVLLLPVRV